MGNKQNLGDLYTSNNDFNANVTFTFGNNSVNVSINSTAFVLSPNTSFSANNDNGSAGQVLTTNGSGVYWSVAAAGVNTDAQYIWSNTQTFQNTITFSTNIWGNIINATSFTTGGGYGSATGGAVINSSTIALGNSTVNSYSNSSSFTAEIGFSNRQSLDMGTFTTEATLNTLIVGPYTISSGNSLIVTSGSRVVIV